jgi:hypothetical protein
MIMVVLKRAIPDTGDRIRTEGISTRSVTHAKLVHHVQEGIGL